MGAKASFTDMVFQSTLPHGERLHPHVNVIARFEFQSTLPHGERQPALKSLLATVLNEAFREGLGSGIQDILLSKSIYL